jgi:Rod binding domain-containing protein
MATSTPGIFVHSVFSGGSSRQPDQKAAAAGFTQIFTTMLAHQMHQSMVGADTDPMGTGGGASGDIYGSMLDQALGKTLAKSPSMKGLTQMISRELAGPRHPIASAFKEALLRMDTAGATRPNSGQLADGIETVMAHPVRSETRGVMHSDKRGPVLLPPAPLGLAPVLQPPSPLEG